MCVCVNLLFLCSIASIMQVLGFTSNQLDQTFGVEYSAYKWAIVVAVEHCVLGLQHFLSRVIAPVRYGWVLSSPYYYFIVLFFIFIFFVC